ncbi:MAG: hypothetical protein JWR69_2379 [Pedosphaera sp.]|nr:hypothetical protein [Pedosphaera sp.]
MRSAVKITFAFLLGLLLAGQGVFTAATKPLAASECACAGCHKICCAPRQAPVPQPVAPARTAAPEHASVFVAVLTRLFDVAPSATAQISTAYSSAPSLAAALPLYQRNCSYLI